MSAAATRSPIQLDRRAFSGVGADVFVTDGPSSCRGEHEKAIALGMRGRKLGKPESKL
jgi:hypothetical protein